MNNLLWIALKSTLSINSNQRTKQSKKYKNAQITTRKKNRRMDTKLREQRSGKLLNAIGKKQRIRKRKRKKGKQIEFSCKFHGKGEQKRFSFCAVFHYQGSHSLFASS